MRAASMRPHSLLTAARRRCASSSATRSSYALATKLTHPTAAFSDPYGATSPPLFQTATFLADGSSSGDKLESILEDSLAELNVVSFVLPSHLRKDG